MLGIFPVPIFFDAVPRWASPFTDPWTWLRTLLVPWLVLAAPLAGMCLRLTLATAREITQEDYVRTAVAKGVPFGRVMRHHVGRPTFGATVSFAPVTLPLFLTNVILVEQVFSVPGFFHSLWAAIGHDDESAINLPIVIAAALWTTVLLIVLGMLADAIVGRLDPRVRDAAFSSLPGVLSGDVVQAPVHVPVSARGNSVDPIDLLDSSRGNTCVNR